ncbi:uncharacterized protein METZ01_LOCUS426067, partial [marine metagenome]
MSNLLTATEDRIVLSGLTTGDPAIDIDTLSIGSDQPHGQICMVPSQTQ